MYNIERLSHQRGMPLQFTDDKAGLVIRNPDASMPVVTARIYAKALIAGAESRVSPDVTQRLAGGSAANPSRQNFISSWNNKPNWAGNTQFTLRGEVYEGLSLKGSFNDPTIFVV